MANKNNYTNHTNKGLGVFCVTMALVVVGACTLGGLQLWGKGKMKPSNWGKSETIVAPGEDVKYETTLPQNGGMTLPEKVEDGEKDKGEVKSNGISLMSVMIPVAQYAAYGISPAAENARTVTATVLPDNEASNTKIRWELSWKDPSASWARGKTVADYVTLQTNADDLMESKTCTVACTQAFGEQIQLKAICVEDDSKYAACNVDYVQQLKSAGVSIGNVSVNLGGNTEVTIAIRRDHDGKGGAVAVTPTLSDTYTVKSTFTGTVTLNSQSEPTTVGDANRKYFSHYYGSLNSLSIVVDSVKDYTGEAIYFDTRFFKTFDVQQFGISRNGTVPEQHISDRFYWKDFTSNEIKDCYNNLHCQGKVLFTMKVRLTSGSYEYNYESDIVWADIDETVPLGDVSINDGQDLIFP